MGKSTRCLWERCLIFFYLLKLYGDVVSCEGLTGAGAFFPLKMVHSHGYWPETSIPHHMGLSTGQPECPHNMVPGFPQDE